MSGSMIEMCLRAFTDLDGTLDPVIQDDGSCHGYLKQTHPHDATEIFSICSSSVQITTPIYPFQNFHLDDILSFYKESVPSFSQDKKILIHAPDQDWAEINMLFQYYKISVGLHKSLDIFGGELNQRNIRNWNLSYSNWREMRRWEYREWLSLFYPKWIREWIESPHLVTDDFLVITNQTILEQTSEIIYDIIEFCGLKTLNSFENVTNQYRVKQQYILNEYRLINNILECTINKQELNWNPISIIGESILQQKFRQIGYEWYCDGLDELPTNNRDFAKIIFKSESDH